MRSPEHKIAQPRAGKHFEDELQLRYMSPGAFTVLPPDNNAPDPPSAPEPYRLTPSTRRHKNKAFAIIGEVDSSRANSRSPSPTGRVSPFRGHGFNPSGSRFATPNATPPPPEDARLTPTNLSPQHVSKIPKLKRKGSSLAFPEVSHYNSSPTKRKLENKLSQSLTNLEPKKIASRPPPSPRKTVHNKTPAFQRLSPISGSSPEPSQSLSSPSRIPKSRSTPPSRRTSPTRTSSSLAHKPPPVWNSSRTVSRTQSRSQSRNQSRNSSRDTSPTKDLTSPTRIPLKYRSIQAKVNSFNKPKPKVPPKPQVITDQSEDSDIVKDVKTKPNLSRKESVSKLRTNSRSNLTQKIESNSNIINNNRASDNSSSVISKSNNKNTTKTNSSSNNNTVNKINNSSTNKNGQERVEENKIQTQSPKKEDRRSNNQALNETPKHNKGNSSPIKSNTRKDHENSDVTRDTDSSYIKEATDSGSEQIKLAERRIKRTESSVKLADILPSTTTVVSSTTTTVTQPLKIDANINSSKQFDRSKQVSPMVDGRVLSATSVSNAMNRMNDSVLNTQTVMKEHGFTRLSPAANAIISVGNEPGKGNTTLFDTKSSMSNMPKFESNITSKMTSTEYNKTTNGEYNRGSYSDYNRANNLENNTTTTTNTDYNRTTNSNQNRVGNTDFGRSMNVDFNKVNNSEQSRVSNPALDTKHATTALPRVEPVSYKPESLSTMDTLTSDRGNNHTNHLSHSGIINAKALETEVQKNMSRLISPEHGNSIQKSVNDRIKEARTMVAADVKPIRITVKEKPSNVDVQSGNVRPPVSISNGLNERPSLPPEQSTPPNEPSKDSPPKNVCSRFFSSCKDKITCQCCKHEPTPQGRDVESAERQGCFSCLKKKTEQPIRISIEDETGNNTKLWDKLKCCNKHKVRDTSCFPTGKRKDSWVDRRDSILSGHQEAPSRSKCSRDCCKDFLKKVFCINLCCKSKVKEDPISRKASILSKKKSLTPTNVPPPEDTRSKIDISLVEQTSHMKGAIPILPICLAWFCLVMNCIAPGTGTFLSGLFCLCVGKPRFSQIDGAKQRTGSFIINTFIGIGQLFTVLFCLVGWGWSIWWGVIMVKMAKKYKKLKLLEAAEEENSRPTLASQNHNSRGPVRNS